MNPEHVEIVKAGKEAIDQWRADQWEKKSPEETLGLDGADLSNVNLIGTDLSGADLSGADLSNSDLSHAILWGANLSGVKLRMANLTLANLSHAKLSRAKLLVSNLTGCTLTQADLSHANLGWAIFNGAILKGTNFANSKLGYTVFAGIDLSEARDWSGVAHTSPSRVDQSTLQSLKGQITPEIGNLLRGIGLERWEIENARLHDPTLTPEQISEHLTTRVFPLKTPGAVFLGGVFLSYAHENWSFVEKLWNGLRHRDITTYLDRHDFTAGSLEKNISRAVRINDQVVVVLSKQSLASDWVWDEIQATLEKEQEIGKDILFPIRIDDVCFEDQRNKRHLTRLIQQRMILDFSNPDVFDENLAKLITGMKVNQ